MLAYAHMSNHHDSAWLWLYQQMCVTDSQKRVHSALSIIAGRLAGTGPPCRVATDASGCSSLKNGVSCHSFSQSVDIRTLVKMKDASEGYLSSVFVGTRKNVITVSLNFGYAAAAEPCGQNENSLSKKRKRNTDETAADDAIQNVIDSVSKKPGVSSHMTKKASTLISRVRSLRSAEGGAAIERWGLHTRPPGPLTLIVKVASGCTLQLSTLLSALGSCSLDGMLTTRIEEWSPTDTTSTRPASEDIRSTQAINGDSSHTKDNGMLVLLRIEGQHEAEARE